MALIDELKEKLAEAVQFVDTESAFVRAHTRNVEDWLSRIDDLDRAIAALEPTEELTAAINAAAAAMGDEKARAIAVLEPVAEPQPTPDEPDLFEDAAAEHISELTGDPAIEPESGLRDYGFAEHVEAERAALNEQMQDEREQPVEGYAPVTNPEADFWARGLAPTEPEKKYNPFGIFKRAKEDA